MQIIVDRVTAPPPHALSRRDIRALWRVIPEEWKRRVQVVHLKATLPENSRFERPVIYSTLGGFRLNVCCRGLDPDLARREILRELAVQGMAITTRYGHRLSAGELARVDSFIEPLIRALEPAEPRDPGCNDTNCSGDGG